MLKQQSVQVVSQTTDLKKSKPSFERNHTFYYKRRSVVKKIQDLVEQYDQQVYLCLHDKKTGKVFEYSSNAQDFSLEQVSNIVQQSKRKTEKEQGSPVKDITCFDEQLDDQVVQDASTIEEGPNESTTESKKNTNASSSGVSDGKSEHSNPTDMKEHDLMDLQTVERYPLHFDYEINHLKEFNADQIFENKRTFQKMNSVLQSYPESLSHCDFSNELSLPIENTRQSLFVMGNITRIDSISNDPGHEHFQDKEVEKIDSMTHFQRRDEDDVGLKFHDQRNEFAQKYLFTGGQNSSTIQEQLDTDIYSVNEESYYSDDESNVSAYDQVYDPNMAEQFEHQDMQKQLSSFNDQNHQLNYLESIQDQSVGNSPNDKTHDMFFACCDWETLRNADKEETTGVTVSKFDDDSTPKGCKHKSKFASKSGVVVNSTTAATEFANEMMSSLKTASIDIDSIIKKACSSNMSERIVSKRNQSSKQLKLRHKKRAQVTDASLAEDSASSHKISDDGSAQKSCQQQMSSPSKQFKLCNTKEQLKEMRACLSPMADNTQRRTVYDASPQASPADLKNVQYQI